MLSNNLHEVWLHLALAHALAREEWWSKLGSKLLHACSRVDVLYRVTRVFFVAA